MMKGEKSGQKKIEGFGRGGIIKKVSRSIEKAGEKEV